jgi:hypothetical protein
VPAECKHKQTTNRALTLVHILLFDQLSLETNQFRDVCYLDARERLDQTAQVLLQHIIIQFREMQVDEWIVGEFFGVVFECGFELMQRSVFMGSGNCLHCFHFTVLVFECKLTGKNRVNVLRLVCDCLVDTDVSNPQSAIATVQDVAYIVCHHFGKEHVFECQHGLRMVLRVETFECFEKV